MDKCRVFVSKNALEIELLYIALKEEFDRAVELSLVDDIKVIYVSKEVYFDVLKKGVELSNKFNINIHYVNASDKVRQLNYLSMMYLVLKTNRQGDLIWENGFDEYCPIDIKRYIEYLKNYTGNKDTKIKYIIDDNAIELLFKCPYEEFENLKHRCKSFIDINDIQLFDDIYFFDILGNLESKDKNYSRSLK